MKISLNLYGRMDGSKFFRFPWFLENSLVCVILRYTVYITYKEKQVKAKSSFEMLFQVFSFLKLMEFLKDNLP